MFNGAFQHGKKFTFNSNGLPYVRMKDVPMDKVYTVREVFINKKSKYGPSPCVVTDDAIINVPNYMINDIELILNYQPMIDSINAGRCGFKRIADYTTKNGNKGYAGEFVDIE